MNNYVKGLELMEHSMQNFNDNLTLMLMENKLILTEGWWPSWKSIKSGFHTAMNFVQAGCAAISLASYSSVVGAPVGLIASVIDAAIDVGYAVGNAIEGDWKEAGERMMWAGIGLIPIAGDTATIAKVGARTAKTIDAASGIVKTIDKIDGVADVAKTISKAEKGADVAKIFKGAKTIDKSSDVAKLAGQVADNSGWASRMSLKAIDALGGTKVGKGLGLAGYADNYKLANASFATLDVKSGKTLLANFATGGDELRMTTKLGSDIFNTAVFGGGNVARDVRKTLYGGEKLHGGLKGIRQTFRRSFLFKGSDITSGMGGNSKLINSTLEVVPKGMNAKDAKFLAQNFELSKFQKIATNKRLIQLNTLNKINKIPQLTHGGIQTYDLEKRKSGKDRRTLFNLGPTKGTILGIPGTDYEVPKALQNIGDKFIWPTVTGGRVDPLGPDKVTYDKYDPGMDQIQISTDPADNIDQDAQRELELLQKHQDQVLKHSQSKQQKDAESELQKQQQKVKNLK
tara:strand:- start:622 stop:2163 length:1542 start_codon:yes stop_codon:yes gene_type:complete